MSDKQFVDVRYRGMEIAKGVGMSRISATTCFIEMPLPLPVGTELTMNPEGLGELRLEVLRVHEQVAGSETGPGARVKVHGLSALSADAATWWEALVTEADPCIPEPPAESLAAIAQPGSADDTVPQVVEPQVVEPQAVESQVVESQAVESVESEPSEIAASGDEAAKAPDTDAEDGSKPKKRRKKRKTRGTR